MLQKVQVNPQAVPMEYIRWFGTMAGINSHEAVKAVEYLC
jgi:hypothetical protein